MSKNLHLVFLCAVACATVLPAQVITPEKDRNSLLDGMEAVLDNTGEPSGLSGEVSSPFFPQDRPAVPAATASAPQQRNETASAVLPDGAALSLIAQQFRPLGSLVLGDRGILQLSAGRTIEKGQAFKAEIGGIAYEVEIEDVTSQGYVLRLGTARIERTFSIAGSP